MSASRRMRAPKTRKMPYKGCVPMIKVFAGDFNLKPGPFPHDYSPLGEYHFRLPEGSTGQWTASTLHFSWQGDSCWNVLEDDGKYVFEQSTIRETGLPMLVAGDEHWDDVVIEASFRPLGSEGYMGVAFRYQTSRHYYALRYGHNCLELISINDEECAVLAKQSSVLERDSYHDIKIVVTGSRLSAEVGGITLEAEDDSYRSGKVALFANGPVRFGKLDVFMTNESYEVWRTEQRLKESQLRSLKEAIPQPQLWRKFDTPGYGAGKSIRFGDLNGDGQLEILLAQNVRRMQGDNFCEISCLTAIDLEGRVLWQIGEPNPANALVTNDLPFQIHDIDGDGKPEIVLCGNFKIQVLEGETGKLKYEALTPMAPPHTGKRLKEDRFYRIVGDSIYFCDLTGSGQDRDILLKDRYNNLWAYTWDLQPLWHFSGNVGHYPMAYDIDGDGKDEILIGYALLNSDGTVRWQLDIGDHADGVFIGKLEEGEDPQIIIAASDEGMLWVSADGEIKKHHRAGHCQTVTAADLLHTEPGVEIATITFWGNPGIVLIYDWQGNLLLRNEIIAPWGSALSPVNWTGSGQDLILLSAHPELGGMIDGKGRRVVEFPSDGHPFLCCEPVDLTGDGRDEIVVWDENSIWIYTQSHRTVDSPSVPKRQPHYNMSNYRAQFSLY